MSKSALNEILVIITNVIRKSAYASETFTGSDKAEDMFDEWQSQILNHAEQICIQWNTTPLLAEWASKSLEECFKAILPPVKETV
jgi:hypothetical protein